MEFKTIKTQMQYRTFEIDTRKIDADKRQVPLSFSSEMPVERYFGFESLDHSAKAVDLSFLGSGRAPLLKDHDRNQQVGIIQSASISGGKGRAVARFGKSRLANEEFGEVSDGIRVNVSVGYAIESMELEKQDEAGEHYRVTKWKPLEISIVSIPADDSVGVGRDNEKTFNTKIINQRSTNIMPVENIEVKDEKNRTADIMAIAKAHNMVDFGLDAIGDGKSASQFNREVLDKLAEHGLIPVIDPTPVIGLTEREKRQFSFVKLLRSMADPGNASLQDGAGFELECSRAVTQKMKVAPKGVFVPHDILTYGRRDLNTTDDSGLVGTQLMAASFIDILSNQSVAMQLATRIDGLVGNLAIPKQLTGASVYWVAENLVGPTESEPTFGTVSLSPKTVGTYSDITRNMLLQSTPAIDFLIQRDLARSVGLGIDLAAFHGTGADNQPTGLVGGSGIGSVAGGTNGAAPDDDDIIDLETAVAVDNGDVGSLAYITNAKVRGKLKKTAIESGYPDKVWSRENAKRPLNGYPCLVTNQISSALTKGTSDVASAILFGNWSDMIIGMWGALDLLVDPFTHSAAGGLRIRALQSIDLAFRHPESFSAMLDALTA